MLINYYSQIWNFEILDSRRIKFYTAQAILNEIRNLPLSYDIILFHWLFCFSYSSSLNILHYLVVFIYKASLLLLQWLNSTSNRMDKHGIKVTPYEYAEIMRKREERARLKACPDAGNDLAVCQPAGDKPLATSQPAGDKALATSQPAVDKVLTSSQTAQDKFTSKRLPSFDKLLVKGQSPLYKALTEPSSGGNQKDKSPLVTPRSGCQLHRTGSVSSIATDKSEKI